MNYGPIYLPETVLVFFTNAITGARKTTWAPAETPLGVGAAVPLEAGRSRRRPGCSWAEDLGSKKDFSQPGGPENLGSDWVITL